MFAMDKYTGKVALSWKTMQAYSESKGTDHITVNACVSTNGLVLLLHIIFAWAFSSGPYLEEGPDGALYSISDNCYGLSSGCGLKNQLFIPKTKHIPGKKCLILDDHGSHLDIELLGLSKSLGLFKL